MNQEIKVGSHVKHPLFTGPGVVERIERDQSGRDVFVIFWQSIGKQAFHSNKSLTLITHDRISEREKETNNQI